MKRVIISVLLAAWFLNSGAAPATDRMSIGEALKKKLISCSIHTTKIIPDSLSHREGHLLTMSLRSLTGAPLEILLESGRRFICHDSAYQNLMITENRVIPLNGGKSSLYEVLAYCINQHRKSPVKLAYSPGSVASGMLLKVAQFLGKNRTRCGAATKAIWVITDDNSIEAVRGRNKYETRMIRNFLYDLTGRARPPRDLEPLSWPSVMLKGEIAWTMPETGMISLVVFDANENRLGCLLNNQPYKKGKQYYTFHYLDDALLPGHNYRLVLMKENAILEEFAVKSQED